MGFTVNHGTSVEERAAMRPKLLLKSVSTTLLVLALALVNCGCKPYTMGDGFRGIPSHLKIGRTFKFGYYGGYYTTWQVLDIEDGKALVVTKYVVDLRDYHDRDSATTWAQSAIRKWLNEDFYSATFSEAEREVIIKTHVADSGPEQGGSGGSDTEDNVFLLSADEVREYMPTAESRLANLLLVEQVEEAAARRLGDGSYFDSPEKAREFIEKLDGVEEFPVFWWLRSAGDVNQHGEILDPGIPVSGFAPYIGVRPAMWIDIDPQDGIASAAPATTDADRQVKPNPSSAKSQIPDGAIKWTEAKKHIGETVTIYGPVKGSKYASTSNGEPTFIDLGASYPDTSRVTIVVWGEDRDNFSGSPEDMYGGKTVCVTGEVYEYRGVCNIEAQVPSQIRVIKK